MNYNTIGIYENTFEEVQFNQKEIQSFKDLNIPLPSKGKPIEKLLRTVKVHPSAIIDKNWMLTIEPRGTHWRKT